MLELPANEREHQKSLTQINYVLYLASAFIFFPGLVAITINLLKLNEVRGTWLESHYRWQINTFWISLSGTLLGIITSAILIGFVVFLVTVVWVAYRAIRGWLNLRRGQLPTG